MPKKGIHPVYHDNVKVICIEGFEYTVSAAVAGPIRVESCPQSHPAYTGKKKKVREVGRIQKYNERMKRMEALKSGNKGAKVVSLKDKKASKAA